MLSKQSIYFIIITFVFMSLLVFINTGRAEQIFFSEIMYDPLGTDSGNEWVEIFNNSSTSLSIASDWRFNDGSNHTINFHSGLLSIAPNNFFVIAQNASSFLNNYPNYNNPLFESSFSLNNSSNTIKLLQGTNISSEQYYSSLLGANGNGKTLERNMTDLSQNIWQESSAIGGSPGDFPIVILNHAPSAAIQISTTTAYIGNNISFSASSSTDFDGNELLYFWNIENVTTSTEENFSYSFTNAGIYNISLTVSDGFLENTQTTTINILENEEDPIEYNGKIILNELLPNPEGDDDTEWIELKNITEFDIDISEFFLKDESGKQYTIFKKDFATTTIKANGFFTIDYLISKIVLNNTSDKVYLFDKNGNQISEISYSGVKEGQSFARFENSWNWTKNPTKNSENILEESSSNSSSVLIINNTTTNNTSEKTIEENTICDLNSINKQLIISEVFTNPKGDDSGEFIEIYNPNDFDINITNWKLKDLSTSFYKLNGVMKSKSYISIPRTESKISLNNSKEEVFIYDCKDNLITSLKYDKSFEDKTFSYSLIKKEYFWTSQKTPEEENVFDEESSVQENNNSSTTQEILSEKIENELDDVEAKSSFNNLDPNELISGYGVVIYTKNKILNNSSYICNYDIANKMIDYYDCLNLYFSGEWPKIVNGSIIKFSGKFSQTSTSKKIKISKKEDLELIGLANLSEPDEILIDNIDEALFGSFISIKGEISKLNKKSFVIKSDEAEIKVKIQMDNFDIKKFAKDEYVFVSGIVLKEKETFILVVANKNDIKKIEKPLEEIDENETTTTEQSINLSNNKNDFFSNTFSSIKKIYESIRINFINKIFASK